jgi:hypothetical protein
VVGVRPDRSWWIVALVALGCGGRTAHDSLRRDAGVSSGGSGASPSAGGTSSGGNGTAGRAGAASDEGVCAFDADCRIYNDCCYCVALAASESDPRDCAADCKTGRCDELQLAEPAARCVAGRCVLSASCDRRNVIEPVEPPACGIPGEIRTVIGGNWGPCIPAGECAEVAACGECDAAGLSCVVTTIDAPRPETSLHCVGVPAACGGTPTCDCMQTCSEPYGVCTDDGLVCTFICVTC